MQRGGMLCFLMLSRHGKRGYELEVILETCFGSSSSGFGLSSTRFLLQFAFATSLSFFPCVQRFLRFLVHQGCIPSFESLHAYAFRDIFIDRAFSGDRIPLISIIIITFVHFSQNAHHIGHPIMDTIRNRHISHLLKTVSTSLRFMRPN